MNIKQPNKFLYFIAYILVYPFLKIHLKLKVDRNGLEMPDGPYIVLSNHSTMCDFFVVMLSLYPRLLNTVAARKFFYYSPMYKLLPTVGCIPKHMFDPDVRSIVGIKTVLKRGGGVLLFPEGRCSPRHAYSGIHKSTGKLLKKLGVPVISSYIEGVVNCMPIWRRGIKYGRTRVTHRNLFSADDLKSMSVEEINAAIDARLSGEDGCVPPSDKPLGTIFSRRLAKGLHRLLYYCPSCNREFTTAVRKNTIYCTACGFEATVNRQCELIYASQPSKRVPISTWYAQQAYHEMQSLSEDMEPIVTNVKVKTPSPKPGGGMVYNGSGTLSIDPKGWHYTGKLGGEDVSLLFPVDAVPAITFDYDTNIQITYDGDYYIFIPENTRTCVKFVIIAECLHWKFAAQPLMTPGAESGIT